MDSGLLATIVPVLAPAVALQASRAAGSILGVLLAGQPLQRLVQILELSLLFALDLTHVHSVALLL